jgi:hypothetical protein
MCYFTIMCDGIHTTVGNGSDSSSNDMNIYYNMDTNMISDKSNRCTEIGAHVETVLVHANHGATMTNNNIILKYI